jgi:Zn-dependent peptidase ImmA (M78 family)
LSPELKHDAGPEDVKNKMRREAAVPYQQDLWRIDLAKAATLKRYWKTSMSSLIRRARDLGVITEQRYKSLMVQLSQRGFTKSEPVEVPREQPSVVEQILTIHRDTHHYTVAQLAKVATMLPAEFENEFMPGPPGPLRLVR